MFPFSVFMYFLKQESIPRTAVMATQLLPPIHPSPLTPGD